MTTGRALKILEKVQILGSATITFCQRASFRKTWERTADQGLDFSPADSPLADKIRPHTLGLDRFLRVGRFSADVVFS